MPFKPGQSGNPQGRPRADGGRVSQTVERKRAAIQRKVIDAAIAGDMAACRIVYDHNLLGISNMRD